MKLEELEFQGKGALVRVDFNVPLDSEGHITDDSRIVAALPTIQHILNQGGSVILMSHLGRPKGEKNPKYSLYPCAARLSKLLDTPVQMAADCVGGEVTQKASQLKPGQVLLLENLRFHGAEEHPNDDPSFAKQLASLGDVFVNDAFGTAHRAHSSNVMIAQYFPNQAAFGFLMQKEIQFLREAILQPKRPFYALIGGAKISTKIGVLESLKDKVDALFIGGGMAYTFLKARGVSIGKSIHEDAYLDEAKRIEAAYAAADVPFYLPLDIVVTHQIGADTPHQIVSTEKGIPDEMEGVDIGPETITFYQEKLQDAATLFWNGPLGVFEVPPFDQGTSAIAKTVAHLPAVSIVGGGDSASAIKNVGLSDQITHMSTGGGASLEFIEKGTLPAIDALS